jgi:hypothetical protein
VAKDRQLVLDELADRVLIAMPKRTSWLERQRGVRDVQQDSLDFRFVSNYLHRHAHPRRVQ